MTLSRNVAMMVTAISLAGSASVAQSAREPLSTIKQPEVRAAGVAQSLDCKDPANKDEEDCGGGLATSLDVVVIGALGLAAVTAALIAASAGSDGSSSAANTR